MKLELTPHVKLASLVAIVALAAGGAGYGIATLGQDEAAQQTAETGRKVLYWYDPMVPQEHYDNPDTLSSMGMKTIPKYADEAAGEAGVAIDPGRTQSLGLRVVEARMGSLGSNLTITGTIDFNQRDIAVIQARAAGFVQRVYARAPGDVVGAGAPLADLLVPEWAGAQAEYLAVRRTGDAVLARAARQRLTLLGMPPGTITTVERGGRPHNVITVSTPVGGTIKTLGVRMGMSVMAGQTLAEVNGLGTVWLNAAVPEAVAGGLRPGQAASATLAAYPGERFSGRIAAILPNVETESRTLTVRIELPNRGGRLRPGMFATVDLGGSQRSALLVPSEALIRTGKRTLVMLALPKGRYQPAEVRTGAEASGQTEILAGLAEGEKVVTSGQFLIDSEASLSGVDARPISGAGVTQAPASAPAKVAAYETVGRIEKIEAGKITISHQAVPAINWPAMTMTFRLADPALVRGFKKGDRVRFSFDQLPQGATVRSIAHESAR